MEQTKRQALAERKWLETYKPPAKVSGKYLYTVPEHVYAGVGGFARLHRERNGN